MYQELYFKESNYNDLHSSNTATFLCRHNITKRPICATPCDGIIEMCENDEDEQCQGAGLPVILLSALFFSISFIISAFMIDYILGGVATCSEGFVQCFLRVPRLPACTAVAVQPKQARETLRKHITKPSEQVAAPPSISCRGTDTTRRDGSGPNKKHRVQ